MSFGRLERNPNGQAMSDINMTPLIDVMLVLLVIFIITAPLLSSSIKLDLPQSDAAKTSDTPKFVTVAVDAAGQIFINDKTVAMDELAQQFAATGKAAPNTEIQLRADKAVPYGRIVEVMGAAHKGGLSRIGFVAEPGARANAAAGSATAAGKP